MYYDIYIFVKCVWSLSNIAFNFEIFAHQKSPNCPVCGHYTRVKDIIVCSTFALSMACEVPDILRAFWHSVYMQNSGNLSYLKLSNETSYYF